MTVRGADEVLARPVFAGGRERPFGELSLAQVADRAAELQRAAGMGHRSRVGGVAAAWGRLATTMRERDAATVGELEADTVLAFAEPLWVEPPGGSLLP